MGIAHRSEEMAWAVLTLRDPASGGSDEAVLLLFACLSVSAAPSEQEPKVGERLPRRGDEIVVCGQLYHTTTKVVLWIDPGGFDAYRVEPPVRAR